MKTKTVALPVRRAWSQEMKEAMQSKSFVHTITCYKWEPKWVTRLRCRQQLKWGDQINAILTEYEEKYQNVKKLVLQANKLEGILVSRTRKIRRLYTVELLNDLENSHLVLKKLTGNMYQEYENQMKVLQEKTKNIIKLILQYMEEILGKAEKDSQKSREAVLLLNLENFQCKEGSENLSIPLISSELIANPESCADGMMLFWRNEPLSILRVAMEFIDKLHITAENASKNLRVIHLYVKTPY